MPKEDHLPIMLKLFRQFGYEGVTLTRISQETGLGKASLYHHFPGGKAEMASESLNAVNQWLETCILQKLNADIASDGTLLHPPIESFETMCKEVNDFFAQGQNACLWAVLLQEQASHDLFHLQISQAFVQWIEAIATLLIAAGLDATLARQRGEDAMIVIQGALILSHGLKDFSPFQRVIQQLPQQLCQDL